MAAVASLLIIITLSLLINRVASTALTYTGLSYGAAKFQARSALTGVGFTTKEAEQIVNHPVRRRIVLLLMLLGNAGIVTSISSLYGRMSLLDELDQRSDDWGGEQAHHQAMADQQRLLSQQDQEEREGDREYSRKRK